MKKIAILTCLDACKVCTGASCLEAWNENTRFFSNYASQEVSLVAFMHCNGCNCDPTSDSGMIEKLDRLVQIGVSTVHTGVCTIKDRQSKAYCPRINAIISMLNERGIETIFGTH